MAEPAPDLRKSWLKALLKISVTLGVLYYIFTQIDSDEVLDHLRTIDLGYFLLALVTFNCAQITSGLRLGFYFNHAGLALTRITAISLYYIGMLFNFVLPGGVGGDGYLAYRFHKRHQFSWKTAVRLLSSCRASGMLWLILYMVLFALLSGLIMALDFVPLALVFVVLATVPSYVLLTRWLLKETPYTQLRATLYSMVVQGLSALTAYWIFCALNIAHAPLSYLAIFMLASLVSIIPISFGGMGLREATFFTLCPLLGLDAEAGIALALVFYIVMLLASLMGVIPFMAAKKLQQTKEANHGTYGNPESK